MTDVLAELYGVIAERKTNPEEGSYTAYLFESGLDKILKKVGEESAETIIAAKNGSPREVACETADLLYHLLVMLCRLDMPLSAVTDELRQRRKPPPG
ncbi:MAG: phosphoribosyl-ATP diphosphatase [Oscillospiraceae bacterium]|nr:phosphoribosyl-ATP diphosphatase [Oscillospiraceae bacterium]